MSKVVEYVLSLKDKLSGTLSAANANVDKLESKLKNVQSASNETGGVLSKLGGIISVAFAAKALFDFGKFILNTGMEMEQTRVRFETFMGTAKLANEEIERMKKFAEVTPFDTPEVIKADQALVAIGITGKDSINVLSKIGNVASATGADFQGLVNLYAKGAQVGKINGEFFHQLRNDSPAMIPAMAKSMGVTIQKLQELSEKGKVSFKDLDAGFELMGGKGGKWANLMDKQSQTVAGRLSNLKGVFYNMAVDAGEAMGTPFGAIVDRLSEVLTWVKDNVSNIGKMFAPFRSAIQPLIDSFARIDAMMGNTGTVGEQLNKAFEKIGYAIQLLSPFIEIASTFIGRLYESVAKVIVIFTTWFKTNKEAQSNLILLYNGFKTAFGMIGEIAGKVLGGIVKAIDGILNRDFTKIGSGLKDIISAPIEVAFNAKTYEGLNDKAPTLTNFFDGKKSATEAARDSSGDTKSSLSELLKGSGTGDKDKSKALKTKVGDVAGTKPVTVNVTIQKLIGAETINTTNLKQSVGDVERMLKEMLLAGVSDFTLLAQKN